MAVFACALLLASTGALAGADALADVAGAHAAPHRSARLTRADERRKCVHDVRYQRRHARRCRALRRLLTGKPRQTAPNAASAPVGTGAAAIAAGIPPPALIAMPPPVATSPASPEPPLESSPPVESGEPAEGGEPPSIPHVQVSAVEYGFSLSRTTVPAGTVIFQFVNDGQDEHNLKIAPPEEGPLTGSFANEPSKGVANLELEMQPGSYTLFCSLPTHEQKGMKATLVVE
ncbi:MAG TPA: cupredoxin domain-containing protein [Solirubrobacteraceae bacterium]|nr:cupredoxin domain-containing protein [Solirubrobacteraceae bacterium]